MVDVGDFDAIHIKAVFGRRTAPNNQVVAIADGRENDFAEQLDNSAGEGTHDALCQSPAEEVMADNEGENQIVHKLADSCGNIGSAGIDGEAWSFLMLCLCTSYEVIYDSGNEEGDRASEKHIPGSAEGVV